MTFLDLIVSISNTIAPVIWVIKEQPHYHHRQGDDGAQAKLCDAAWAYTKQAIPYLLRCTDIVSVGRVSWMETRRLSGSRKATQSGGSLPTGTGVQEEIRMSAIDLLWKDVSDSWVLFEQHPSQRTLAIYRAHYEAFRSLFAGMAVTQ